MHFDPGIIALYGPLKEAGKTVELVAANPTALIVAAPSALDSAREVLQIEPAEVQLHTLPEIVLAVEGWDRDQTFANFSGLTIDDATLTIADSMAAWRVEHEDQVAKGARENQYYAFNQHDRWLARLRAIMRRTGKWCFLSFHELAPEIKNGVVLRKGGPQVGSTNKVDVLPGASTTVLRSISDETGADPWWPRLFSADPTDPRWIGGDRHNVLSRLNPTGPHNLRELLRAAGIIMPRWPGLEWQDEWAQLVADGLAAGHTLRDLAHHAAAHLQGVNPAHIQWAVRDGLARYGYASQKRSWLDAFSTGPAGGLTMGPRPRASAPTAPVPAQQTSGMGPGPATTPTKEK